MRTTPRTPLRLAVAAVTGLSLAACGSAVPSDGDDAAGADGSDGAVTIEVMSNFTSDVARGKVLDELISEFNEAHAGEYEVTSTTEGDWPALQQKIRSLITAGSAPDLFLYNFNPTDLSREQSGALMDWGPYLEEDPEWAARFAEGNLEALAVDGAVAGIPGDQSPALVYYHEDLLAQAGAEEFPETWDEALEVGRSLKDEGVGAFAMMTADDAWHTMNLVSYLATSAGGADVYAPGQSLDSPAVERAADYTKRLLDVSTPDAVGANYSVSSANFLAGRAAAVIDGPWLISSIQSEVEDPCSVKVAPAPVFDDSELERGYTVTDALNVWGAAQQDDPAKEEAVVEWMKFFTSNSSAARMAVDGEYALAVQTELSPEDAERASCQMAQVLEITNAAPTSVVQMGRGITASAQAGLPSLLEGLALGQQTPESFAAALEQSNTD
jgi:raffinose/stachyose/melibiose transport system substrate-binding protein